MNVSLGCDIAWDDTTGSGDRRDGTKMGGLVSTIQSGARSDEVTIGEGTRLRLSDVFARQG